MEEITCRFCGRVYFDFCVSYRLDGGHHDLVPVSAAEVCSTCALPVARWATGLAHCLAPSEVAKLRAHRAWVDTIQLW